MTINTTQPKKIDKYLLLLRYVDLCLNSFCLETFLSKKKNIMKHIKIKFMYTTGLVTFFPVIPQKSIVNKAVNIRLID